MLGQRARCDALREQPIEVGLVLRVLGRGLEALRLAVRAARRPALVAHLVDLAPALRAFWLLVVGHLACQSSAIAQVKRAALHRLWTPAKMSLVPHALRAPLSVCFLSKSWGPMNRIDGTAVARQTPTVR